MKEVGKMASRRRRRNQSVTPAAGSSIQRIELPDIMGDLHFLREEFGREWLTNQRAKRDAGEDYHPIIDAWGHAEQYISECLSHRFSRRLEAVQDPPTPESVVHLTTLIENLRLAKQMPGYVPEVTGAKNPDDARDIPRLRDRVEFISAVHEITVAAWHKRMGFDVEFVPSRKNLAEEDRGRLARTPDLKVSRNNAVLFFVECKRNRPSGGTDITIEPADPIDRNTLESLILESFDDWPDNNIAFHLILQGQPKTKDFEKIIAAIRQRYKQGELGPYLVEGPDCVFSIEQLPDPEMFVHNGLTVVRATPRSVPFGMKGTYTDEHGVVHRDADMFAAGASPHGPSRTVFTARVTAASLNQIKKVVADAKQQFAAYEPSHGLPNVACVYVDTAGTPGDAHIYIELLGAAVSRYLKRLAGAGEPALDAHLATVLLFSAPYLTKQDGLFVSTMDVEQVANPLWRKAQEQWLREGRMSGEY